MANVNFKGRQKGSTKKVSSIIDPIFGDYKIIFDEDTYNLVSIDPETQKEKVLGYYSQLSGALRKIVRNQTVKKQPIYSLKEYIDEFETTLTNFKNSIDNE